MMWWTFHAPMANRCCVYIRLPQQAHELILLRRRVHHGRPQRRHRHHPATTTTTVSTTTGESDGEEAEDVGDPEAWATLNKGFRQVQSVLDRNRLLIQQVNENQQSRMHDNMVKNVSLIQELNGNISKVVSLYSDLNTNFSNVCQQRSKNSSK
ncbi:Protein EARLY FLOWERING 4 [Glycine soja]|uniref:Protein EARLY FLOWERING 4 n=1 Tax=Glycine soja TaxID=3848 RepID=A0A0B2RJF7_GLYSO|nr:Protein EARLY FLOWERING 4 [Glycine soja]